MGKLDTQGEHVVIHMLISTPIMKGMSSRSRVYWMGHGYPVVGCRNVKGNFQLHTFLFIVLSMPLPIHRLLICDVRNSGFAGLPSQGCSLCERDVIGDAWKTMCRLWWHCCNIYGFHCVCVKYAIVVSVGSPNVCAMLSM